MKFSLLCHLQMRLYTLLLALALLAVACAISEDQEVEELPIGQLEPHHRQKRAPLLLTKALLAKGLLVGAGVGALGIGALGLAKAK